ncbi:MULTISPECIES: DUF7659 family protein [Salinimonas]|uniref:Uncharacterized protein n=2 Tax=Salinimonas TaxID=288793 RepID=A0A5B7YJ34_9ALTE|nr:MULTISPECIES: hypothetical protein [Salinimonas]MBD3587514.1 hypothetical protein [Salinimonas profundi]QCZ95574.1 hypothetical protein FBQ74_18815 [Salinimonas iocasae]
MTAFIQEKQTELFNELGVFFAFTNEQFEERKAPGVEYCTVLGAGDCVPKLKAKEFSDRLKVIHEEGRAKEIAEKGIDQIIEEQLVNHECFYTGDIGNAVHALAGYGVTHLKVAEIYGKVAQKYADW